MKSPRTIQIGALAALCLAALPAPGQQPAGKDTIFIGRVKIQPSVVSAAQAPGKELELQRMADVLDTQLLAAFSQTGTFQLVERKRKDDLELEQAFAQVAVDPNDATIAQLGRMAGAKYVCLATLDGFEDRSQTIRHEAIGRESTQREIFVSAILQIVDVTSGRILPEVPSVQMTKKENVQLARPPAGAWISDRALTALGKEMAEALARQATAYIRPAKVLAVTGKQILINQGTGAGFQAGTEVALFATQKIVDEDTGETFMNDVQVGKAKVSRSDARQSFAILEGEDLGVAKGCIARPLAAKTQSEQGPDSPPANDRTPAGSSEKPW